MDKKIIMKLKKFIKENGKDVCKDALIIEEYLNKYGIKIEAEILVKVISSGVIYKILDKEQVSLIDRDNFIRGFREQSGVDEYKSAWAIDSWMYILGFNVNDENVKMLNYKRINNICEVKGNSNGNISNSAIATTDGENIYYCNGKSGWQLYRFSLDFKDKTYITEDFFEDENANVLVNENWIYYRNAFDNQKLYRVKTDGTFKEKMCNDIIQNMYLVGDFIYYINASNRFNIYRININSKKKRKISEENIDEILLYKDWIYYYTYNEHLYRINLKDENKQMIKSGDFTSIKIFNDNIFFIQKESLYKMDLDGKNKKMILKDCISEYVTDGDWIYYINDFDALEESNLYMIDINGNNKKRLNYCDTANVRINGDYIYYQNCSEGYKPYMLMKNGLSSIKISDEDLWIINISDNKLYCRKDEEDNTIYVYDLNTNEFKKLSMKENIEMICVKDDYIYFMIWIEEWAIYKSNMQLGDICKLNEHKGSCMNIVGDWLYYINELDMNKIYRIKTDGSQDGKICNDKAYYLNIVGNWIYFCNASYNDRIYKMNLDGSRKMAINSDFSKYVNVINRDIYYLDTFNEGIICKAAANGSDKKSKVRLSKEGATSITVANGYIYYINQYDLNRLYRIRLDGSDKMKISSTSCTEFNIQEDYLIYVTVGARISKMDLDGKNKVAICNGKKAVNMSIVGDWIFFRDWFQFDNVWAIKIDGSKQIEFKN